MLAKISEFPSLYTEVGNKDDGLQRPKATVAQQNENASDFYRTRNRALAVVCVFPRSSVADSFWCSCFSWSLRFCLGLKGSSACAACHTRAALERDASGRHSRNAYPYLYSFSSGASSICSVCLQAAASNGMLQKP